MDAKLKVGQTFAMGRIDCVISVVDRFGMTPHYGFTYRTDAGVFQSGWMPCEFVDNFTGHFNPKDDEQPIVPLGFASFNSRTGKTTIRTK